MYRQLEQFEHDHKEFRFDKGLGFFANALKLDPAPIVSELEREISLTSERINSLAAMKEKKLKSIIEYVNDQIATLFDSETLDSEYS